MYREIAPPDRLIYTEIFAPFPDVESVVTTVLTEENGKTRLTVTTLYPSADVRDMVIKTGMKRAPPPSVTTGSKISSGNCSARVFQGTGKREARCVIAIVHP